MKLIEGYLGKAWRNWREGRRFGYAQTARFTYMTLSNNKLKRQTFKYNKTVGTASMLGILSVLKTM